ncbi:hypothetical protein EAH57_09255 [Acinetobacter sp. 2JN-4]|nr:hypothetical protein EAH57_09255 [Acinetobacter sp. 2JN-4]
MLLLFLCSPYFPLRQVASKGTKTSFTIIEILGVFLVVGETKGIDERSLTIFYNVEIYIS